MIRSPIWDHFGTVLGPFWDRDGDHSTPIWGVCYRLSPFVTICHHLGLFCHRFGTPGLRLSPFWDCFGTNLVLSAGVGPGGLWRSVSSSNFVEKTVKKRMVMKKEISMSELNEIQVCLDRIYGILGLNKRVFTQEYKAKSKSQLAEAADVSRDVLVDWMNQSPHKEILESMGINKYTKVLHPRAVAYVCEQYGIVL